MTQVHADLESVRPQLADLVPMVHRVHDLDPRSIVRLRAGGGALTCYARLPFGVLVSRTIPAAGGSGFDHATGAADLLGWLEADGPVPTTRDSDWRTGLPPVQGWRRLDSVPAGVVLDLVRAGARALREAADAEGAAPGAQPRAEVADRLLDSIVLTASDGPLTAEVNLRTLSGLTRMGFLADGSTVGVDLAGRWIRVAAAYGSAFAERVGVGLSLAPR